jgi:hypothetical protein
MASTVISTPAVPLGDEPLDAITAMLFSPKAPLAKPPRGGGRSDTMAVWACVPGGFNAGAADVLVYFHGHNYFVTAKKAGGRVVGRPPDWLTGAQRAAAASKAVSHGPAGHFYKFDAIAGPRQPLVLLPEDGTLEGSFNPPQQSFWSREKPGTLGVPRMLGDLVDDCVARLTVLSPTGAVAAGAGYLPAPFQSSSLKRFFLTGHSGGGVPLFVACASTLATTTPTSLWAFDATYGAPAPAIAVRKFCEAWDNQSHLGNGPADASVVVIFNHRSGTDTGAIGIRDELRAPANHAAKRFPVTEVTFKGGNGLPAVEAALRASPVVIIETDVAHEDVPATFTPILLRNAP